MTAEYSAKDVASAFTRIENELAHAQPSKTLDVLCRSAADTVPGAQMAGVTICRQGEFATRGATDELVRTVDEIQYRLRTGPCVDAIVQDTTFNAADLRTDPRWPEFGRETAERTGVLSMLSFRLFLENDDDLVAALNMYSTHTAAFDETSEALGLILATHGALAVARATAREKADNLLIALKTSREIGVAMGILMTNYKITRDEAFDLLRLASQGLHRKLADIASTVADTGELPAVPARRTPRTERIDRHDRTDRTERTERTERSRP